MNTFTCWTDDPADTWKCEDFDHESAAIGFAEHCSHHSGGEGEELDGAAVYVSDGAETQRLIINTELRRVFCALRDESWTPTPSETEAGR